MMAICLSAETPFFYKDSTCTYSKLAGGSLLIALTPLTSLVYSSLIGYVSSAVGYCISCLRFRSGSMGTSNQVALADGPAKGRILQHANNRLSAVYSALYSFWTARHAAIAVGQQSGGRGSSNFWSIRPGAVTADRRPDGARRDAYSVVLFNDHPETVLTNDFTGTPDQLLNILLRERPSGATNFSEALRAGQSVMVQNWSSQRLVIINPIFICSDSHESTDTDLPS